MAQRRQIVLVVLGFAVALPCDGANSIVTGDSPAPTAVFCGDAPYLRQRALDDRRLSVETKSDQDKIVAISRATFYASLAIIADLKCQANPIQTDEALKPAFNAARKAEATRSFYERAGQWGEAGFIATHVIPLLMKQASAPPK